MEHLDLGCLGTATVPPRCRCPAPCHQRAAQCTRAAPCNDSPEAGAHARRAVAAASVWAASAGAARAAEEAAVAAAHYAPSPVEPSFEVWVGLVAGVIPFIIASVEFGKRISLQRRCEACGGKGLVPRGPKGQLRKCLKCGGMLPWLGWRYFFFSTAQPGNGGPLLQPRGQTSVFYEVPGKQGSGQEPGQGPDGSGGGDA